MHEAETCRAKPGRRGSRAGIALRGRGRPISLFLSLALLGCAAAPPWVRPERSLEENRADYAACEERTYRQLRAEFGYEVGLSGGSVPGFPSQNPIPAFPQRGSIAASSTEDPLLRHDIESARIRADYRRQQLMRACLTQAGFRPAED
jgi:hypothetical protein